MARPRQFDPEQALDTALEAFWSRGYTATSMDDLCRAMGISKSSLYQAFGCKQALLEAALERYRREALSRIRAQFEDVQPVQDAVRRFLHGLVRPTPAEVRRRGCFLGNCAAELAGRDEHTAGQVREGLLGVEGIFQAALQAGQTRGELAASSDCRALARFLVASVQGLRLLAKTGAAQETLDDVIDTVVSALR